MSTEEQEDNSDASSSDADPVEWLATGRAKRSNAGNRLQAMLSMEETQDEKADADEEEDQVAALFMEDDEEPDEEFEEKEEDDEEAGDSSSSSDEDEQAQDELAGEKQLQKEERDKQKAQKRKADKTFARPKLPPAKRVRISEPASRRASVDTKTPDRKRRKSEKTTWTLDEDDGKTRTSSRTLSVQNKQRTRESLKESEAKRMKQIAVIEASREKKQAESKGPMTQEDRLREAAQVEKQNESSLNRWQEQEEERVKRQKQKLEALHNRNIEGPMIRWWSGPATWVGDKLTRVGRPKPVQDAEVKQTETVPTPQPGLSATPNDATVRPVTPYASSAAHTQQTPSKTATSFLDGIEQFASLPDTTPQATSPPTPLPQPPQPPQPMQAPPIYPQPYPTYAHAQALLSPSHQPNLLPPQTPLQQFLTGTTGTATPYPSIPTQPPPPPITALRSTLTLQNFDPIVRRSTEAQRRIVFGLKSHDESIALKQPIPEQCAVTAQKARYRDPLTGMPYRGLAEFRRLRGLPGLGGNTEDGDKKARWSGVLEAWVGSGEGVRGVPASWDSGVVREVEKTSDAAEGPKGVEIKPEADVATAG